MPLLGNDTDGAVTRKRLETWAALREKVTVVAATDAATTQAQATLAAAGDVVYTMTPSYWSYLDHTNRCGTRCSVHR
jgi:aspartate/methionine/tyrosine aminotransferase